MLNFLPADTGAPLKVLCLGAHSDDIEIGLGAAVLRLVRERKVHLTWVVLAASGRREEEARASAEEFTRGAAGSDYRPHSFPDSFFPSQSAEIKRCFEGLKAVNPDLIFTHARHDLHQDHRVVCELTWNTFRDHFILEYEVPKYDGDLGTPNFYIHSDKETAQKKAALLRKHFLTQGGKHWFDEDLFMGLMRVRGMESRSPGGYAEGFYARKVTI